MMINLHSWNVRGLEMGERKYLVRKWCNNLPTKDIACLQEIKAIGFQAVCMSKFLWDKATSFHSEHDKGKGGVVILVGPKWAENILQHGCSPC
jgi:exonuclease III